MSCPRSIKGSAGSRIKVILGNKGSDYVLLIDHDDGESVWQSPTWNWTEGINEKLTRQITNCEGKGRYVTAIASNKDGGWYIHGKRRDGTGGHCWCDGINTSACSYMKEESEHLKVSLGDDDEFGGGRWVVVSGRNGFLHSNNLNEYLVQRINRINRRKKAIHFISLLNDDCYYISDEEGSEWVESNQHLEKELESKNNDKILGVLKALDGSWLVIRGRSYSSSTGISSDLTKALSIFYSNHAQRVYNRNAAIQKYHEEILKKQELMRLKEEERQRRIEEEILRKLKEEEERQRQIKEELKRSEEIRQKQLLNIHKSEIIAKNIQVGDRVTALGISQSMGDFRVVSIAFGLLHIQQSRSSEIVEVSPSKVTLHHTFYGNQKEFALLCVAHDKYEAAAALYHCICDGTSCICTKSLQGNLFIPSSIQNGTCRERITFPDTVTTTNNHNRNNIEEKRLFQEGQRVYVQGFTHANINDIHNVAYEGLIGVQYDDGKRYHVKSESITTEEVIAHPLPPLGEHEEQAIEYFDEYKCVEKIDISRLEQIHQDLRTDYEDRKVMYDNSIESTKQHKTLQRCRELEMVVNAMVGFLKGIARDKSRRYVEYEVEYEHRDPSGRGRLFANGLKVKVDKDKYPRTTTLQGMHRDLRAPLVGEFAHDIDCENSEVRLLCSLAIQLNLKDMFPTLFEYRDNRKAWLGRISSSHDVSESDAKRLPNILINGGQYETWLRAIDTSVCIANSGKMKHVKEFVFRLKAESMALRDKLLLHPRYRWTEVERKSLSDKGKVGGAITMALLPRIIQCCENTVLGIIHRCFFDNKWIVRAKVFDGLIVEKNLSACLSIEEVMRKAEAACMAQGWDIQLCEKPLHGLQFEEIETIAEARKCRFNRTGERAKRRRY